MRLFSLAQLTLLGAALALSSCNNKQEGAPTTDATNTTDGGSPSSDAIAQGSAPPTSTSPYKRYGVPRAHIHYEVSGYRRGQEDLYFDNWGRKEARYINVEDLMEQGVRPVKTTIVTNGSYMQMANLLENRGTYMTERVVDSLMHQSNVDAPDVISDTIMSRMGYKRQGDSTVLGLPTSVWFESTSGTKLYTWQGMVLKQEVNNPQHHHVTVAVSIDTTSTIPDSIFVAPKSITYDPMPARPGGPGPGPGPR